MAEPITLADVRQQLRLEADYTYEDELLTSMIPAARRGCENYLNRSVIGTTRTAVFQGFPIWPYYLTGQVPRREQLLLTLPGGNVSAVNSVTYYDGAGAQQTLSSASYQLDAGAVPATLAPIDVWPTSYDRPDAVSVAYTIAALSADDTALVSQAMRLLIGNWFANRESVAVDVRGVPTEMPHTVAWLLDGLRVSPFR